MQSSTAVAARAIVMLACLVSIPLLAVFGRSLPELVMKLYDERPSQETTFSRDDRPEAPEFYPGEDTSFVASGPKGAAAGVHPAGTSAWGTNPKVVPAHVTTPSATRLPAGYEVPIVSPSPGIPDSVTGPARSTTPQHGREGSGPVGPAHAVPLSGRFPQVLPGQATRPQAISRQPPPAGVGAAASAGSQTGVSSVPAPSDGGTFVLIQERLRDMGAVYYRLESWGTQQQLFRFQCEMAVEGSRGLTRHFEAVDSHPLLAMHKVLVEAETWVASR